MNRKLIKTEQLNILNVHLTHIKLKTVFLTFSEFKFSIN